MKFSNMFIPTTKEAPKDASLPSHKYLIRAGFISSQGSGLYDYLPLGKKVLDNIKTIIKDELDNAGCNEVQLSFVTPISLWQESGRANKMGLEMLRIKDRKNASFVLSPTNEEAIVNLVRNRITSYKNLPLNLYQINTKFRDEARPRFGLMRGREFLMKDGYSFHSSTEDMQREFEKMEQVYSNIFKKLGLDFRIVNANSGAIGGAGSKEFMVLADSGEDTILICDSCDYSANIEAGKRAKPTDISCSIDETKEIIKKAIFEDREEIVKFILSKNDVLEETKAISVLNCLELFDIDDANNISIDSDKIKIFVSDELEDLFQDNQINQDNIIFSDLVTVQEGDICTCCGGKLTTTKGIEVGHIFQLGDIYSKALNANFLDENGKSKPFIMGTYGIGVSRLIAAVIEQSHDDKGCIWTKSTTPFDIEIIVSNSKNREQSIYAEILYQDLKYKKIKPLLDDRKKERFGVKIKDFELIGIPYAIIIGNEYLVNRKVELLNRKTGEKELISSDSVFEMVTRFI